VWLVQRGCCTRWGVTAEAVSPRGSWWTPWGRGSCVEIKACAVDDSSSFMLTVHASTLHRAFRPRRRTRIDHSRLVRAQVECIVTCQYDTCC
jgi:hypothetical protein